MWLLPRLSAWQALLLLLPASARGRAAWRLAFVIQKGLGFVCGECVCVLEYVCVLALPVKISPRTQPAVRPCPACLPASQRMSGSFRRAAAKAADSTLGQAVSRSSFDRRQFGSRRVLQDRTLQRLGQTGRRVAAASSPDEKRAAWRAASKARVEKYAGARVESQVRAATQPHAGGSDLTGARRAAPRRLCDDCRATVQMAGGGGALHKMRGGATDDATQWAQSHPYTARVLQNQRPPTSVGGGAGGSALPSSSVPPAKQGAGSAAWAADTPAPGPRVKFARETRGPAVVRPPPRSGKRACVHITVHTCPSPGGCGWTHITGYP
eukprot:COSAG01_NODE_4908_length_4635_cov_2.867725_3_plen_324_part_00